MQQQVKGPVITPAGPYNPNKRWSLPGPRSAVLLFLLMLGMAACSRDPVAELLDAAPLLTEDAARHLVLDSDGDLRSYLADIGYMETEGLLTALYWARYTSPSLEAFQKVIRSTDPAEDRILFLSPEQWGFRVRLDCRSQATALDPMIRYRLIRASRKAQRLSRLPNPLAAADSLLDLVREVERLGGATVYLGTLYGRIADCYRRGMEREPQIRFRRKSIAEALRAGNYGFACQGYGELGSAFDNEDSLLAAWDAGLRLALKTHNTDHIARFYTFFANHIQRRGNLAAAFDLRRLVLETCRESKGEVLEARYLLSWITQNASMGCWNLVAEDLLRIPGLLRQTAQNAKTAPSIERWTIEYDRLRARLTMARGDLDRATDLYEKLERDTRDYTYPSVRIDPLLRFARGLVEHGRYSRAVEIAETGRRYSESVKYLDAAARFIVIETEARLARGDLEGLEARLDHAGRNLDDMPTRIQDWALHDALRARLLLARGRPAEALDSLTVGLNRFERFLGAMDPTELAYFDTRHGEPLRALLHELAGDNAGLGYAIEMAWRNLGKAIGQGWPGPGRHHDCLGSLVDRLRRPGSFAGHPSLPPGKMHVVYRVGPDRVTRWTADAAGIRRFILPVSPDELHEKVDHVLGRLRGKAHPGDTDLAGPLHELARVLLPASCLDGTVTELAVTSDLFLDLLPFGALSLDAGRYEPLLGAMDVVRVRESGFTGDARPSRPGLIISEPRLSRQVRRLHAGLPDLPYGAREAAHVAELVPGALRLTGDSARKGTVTGTWEDRAFLYFATHVVADPTAPYLSFVPLSPAAGDTGTGNCAAILGEEYLGVYDVRRADLSACPLVVLSGCSSGRPYVNAHSATIGLGDAFLDAGAHTVIQTSWDVGDANAAALMTRFVTLWASKKLPPVRALNQARREAMNDHGPGGSVWAAYTVTVRTLDDL